MMINSKSIKGNKKYLILITGLPASGKTTIAKRLANEFGLHYIGKDEYKISHFDSRTLQREGCCPITMC